MLFDDFRALVERLTHEIPGEFDRGVVDVEVNPKTVPHPVHDGVYTLGECVPLTWTGDGADLQSRIVLFYGSFAALARRSPGFDWRAEVWDTLTHELRHHLEFRARVDALEVYDWAAEQNFARHEGQAFDPLFYRSGEKLAEGVYKVDDDVFLETRDPTGRFAWHGKRYRASLAGVRPPAFLTLNGLADTPHGDAILVLPKRSSLRDLWRRTAIMQTAVTVETIDV